MKATTVRLPVELDEALTRFSRAEDLSKNHVIKKAVREFLNKKMGKQKGKTAREGVRTWM